MRFNFLGSLASDHVVVGFGYKVASETFTGAFLLAGTEESSCGDELVYKFHPGYIFRHLRLIQGYFHSSPVYRLEVSLRGW